MITEETNTMKEKLKELFNQEYDGTDPINDAIKIETLQRSKRFLEDEEISSKKVENYPF